MFLFKITVPYNPYFYVQCRKNTERDVLAYLSRKYAGRISRIEIVDKEDLDLVCSTLLFPKVETLFSLWSLLYLKANHLIGLKQTYLKLLFLNVDELIKVRRDLSSVIRRNKETSDKNSYDRYTFEIFSNRFRDTVTPCVIFYFRT